MTEDKFNTLWVIGHIKPNMNTPCHEWIGKKDKDGYGRCWYQSRWNGLQRIAHRVSFILKYGFIMDGEIILHECDNPSCVNPLHLREGSPYDNSQDMVIRNRQTCGEDLWSCKVSEQYVIELRLMPYKENLYQEEGDKLGVHPSNIQKLRLGTSFKHLNKLHPPAKFDPISDLFLFGERHGKSVLTDEYVIELRSRPYYRGLYNDECIKTGHARGTLKNARVGNTWKHLNQDYPPSIN